MSTPWNLTTHEWSSVLLEGAQPETLASSLVKGHSLPWSDVLCNYSEDSTSVLDLGSGRGEHSATLALKGRQTTLLDWSDENLYFSTALFKRIGIAGRFCRADMTTPLPFKSNSFDIVFSCGVFEYFTVGEKIQILREAFRVAKKRVIIMVPNGWSIAYRFGKWYMEKTGKWAWGGEVPSYTLQPLLREAGCTRIIEYSVAAQHSLDFLTLPLGKSIKNLCIRFLKLTSHSNPVQFRQGYLLVTIGEKNSGSVL